MKTLVALPVYNESAHVDAVLDEVTKYADDVLVVDDGSTDGTAEQLTRRTDIKPISKARNQGYGAALKTAFQYSVANRYDAIITIDCDHQHEPERIPQFMDAIAECDMVSGSRYMTVFDDQSAPPEDRWKINRIITAELNRQLGLELTDAFCGFKAYRVDKLPRLQITETGYAMPLELWVQAAAADLQIRELAVPLIYLDEERSFGGELDHAETRLRHYREVIQNSLLRSSQQIFGAGSLQCNVIPQRSRQTA
jgi:dolichol-phosphate mannosyltransferase